MSWSVLAAAGEPRATIRVRNLQATLGAGAAQDAWGRNGRPQPCLMTAEVALASPFPAAAVSDSVAQDTVHYGTLSKAMLKSVGKWQAEAAQPSTLGDVVNTLWVDLTGNTVTGEAATPSAGKAVLDVAATSRLTVSVLLPKASLVGDGVSLTATAVLGASAAAASDTGNAKPRPWATTLKLHRLRVPVLVGVHPHERTAKQAVLTDVSLDGYGVPSDLVDEYASLEALVVRTLEASSFETLEALATHLGRTILEWGQASSDTSSPPAWNVHVALEKPIAVPFADAPIVEVRMGRALA
ncbi:hypothetical protein F503_06955 [Ophiostoma piceae UAMH 11346]|uniref:dihydroneopterin aldolase n=1 Tax=Ophiostoma piceae (strain UAMH 11346) TaxID=1262450 RepID=S3C6N9_OPHP1|nr:hypothetical protein F503_06955 [Ophiostoma piceae UAMH 11346]